MSMALSRVESFYTAFPKLLGSDSQHTFIETDQIRYVYQPIESLYLILITTKQSNIIEDLDTLRFLSRLIPTYCSNNEEWIIKENAFELVFAFDEVISNGHREPITLQQVKVFTDMDSQEEKLQNLITESKILDAREEMKRKARIIDQQKSELKKKFTNESISSESFFYPSHFETSNQTATTSTWSKPASTTHPSNEHKPPVSFQPINKGMKLGKKKTDDYLDQSLSSLSLSFNTSLPNNLSSQIQESEKKPSVPTAESIELAFEENIICSLEPDGTLRKLEIKGALILVVKDPEVAKLSIQLSQTNPSFLYTPSPKIDKTLWSENRIICLKNKEKMFGIGSDNASSLLRWRFQTDNRDMLPLHFTFWPELQNGRYNVNVEYTMPDQINQINEIELQDVNIVIPCNSSEIPTILNCDGQYVLLDRTRQIVWKIPSIKCGDSGCFEFSVPQVDPNSFYPIEVLEVQHALENTTFPFSSNSILKCVRYVIE